jgi:hypothetical protein
MQIAKSLYGRCARIRKLWEIINFQGLDTPQEKASLKLTPFLKSWQSIFAIYEAI